jgi:hypothetical protein
MSVVEIDTAVTRRVRVLPETWAASVSAFIRSAGSSEEAVADNRPQLVFSRVYLPTQMNLYSDFNIRSRHFRCQETFFVEADDDGTIGSVVSLEGLRTKRRVSNVSLIATQLPADDPGGYLVELLDQVLDVAARFSAVTRLRFSYIYDTSFDAPLGVRMSSLLFRPPQHLPFFEEGRIPNETGKNREVVLLAFPGRNQRQPMATSPANGDGAAPR